MIHHHALAALRPALSYYLTPANRAAWLELFTDTASDTTHLEALYAELSAQPPELRPYAQASLAKPPCIIAQLTARRVTDRPLGGTYNGGESLISEQSATLEILARGADEADALAHTTIKALQQARADFLKNGYIYIETGTLSELAPHETLTAEEMGIFVRRLEIRGRVMEGAARLGAWDTTLGPLTLGLTPEGRVSPARF
jgi:hypothetical protein